MAKVISVRGPIVPSSDKRIYDFFGIQCTCPQDIEKGITSAAGAEVVLEISSKGGDVEAGVDMYSMLKDYAGGVHSKVMSWCFSAATFLACAGTCEITPGGLYLVHNVQNSAYGDYRAMEANKQLLQTVNAAVAAMYSQKTGKSIGELLSLMDEDRVLSAQDAVEYGFAEKVMFENNISGGLQLAANVNSGLLPIDVVARTKQFLGDGKKAALLKAEIDLLELGGKNNET